MSTPYNAESTADVLVKDYAQEIKGKVVLITGVSPGGLGATFVEQIVKADPKLLILAGRNSTKNQATADQMSSVHPGVATRTLTLDLENLKQVGKAADEVNGWDEVPYIDVLVNNAAIMACDYGKTTDGIERQFATNHVGPFLFTNLLIPKLLASKDPRVVMVSSDGHRFSAIRWADVGFSDGKLYNAWQAYGQSKTANILMATSLAKKLGNKGLTAISIHPGVIATNLGNNIDWSTGLADLQKLDRTLGNMEGFDFEVPFKSLLQGTATHVYAAFDPSLKAQNGEYLQDCHIADPYTETIKPYAKDAIEADRLWTLTEGLVGRKFQY